MQQGQQQLLNRALTLISQNELIGAVGKLETILKQGVEDSQVLYLLGQSLAKLKDWDKAIDVLLKVIVGEPRNAHAAYCLAYCYEHKEAYPEAVTYYKKTIALDIDYWQAYYRLANILIKDNQEILATKYLHEADKINGINLDIYKSLGEAYKRIGTYDQAVFYCKESYRLGQERQLLAVLIFLAHSDPRQGLKDFLQLAEEYNTKFLSKLTPKYKHSLRNTKTKIKLGFVSADYRNHPISSYLISIFKLLNRDDFEIHLYYNSDKVDKQTKLLQELADSFSFVKELGDTVVADQIYNDQIDILFDMTGHTSGERLAIFKLKPAPIQITHQGYFGTLAIPEIDYIIADDCLIPKNEDQYFTEKIIRLKSFAHADLYAVPTPVLEPPCVKNGFITFAGMNSIRKISKDVIETWAEIMKAVPRSKILLDSKALVVDTNREYFYGLFEGAGIERERILIDATVERSDYLLNFNRVDIMLDTSPYGGGTSSLEALMLGVPVVTIEGDRWVGRMTSSFLKNIGHEELISQTQEEFIAKAIQLAENPERIAVYRTQLPQDLRNSALNIKSFVADFEANLKKIYNELDL